MFYGARRAGTTKIDGRLSSPHGTSYPGAILTRHDSSLSTSLVGTVSRSSAVRPPSAKSSTTRESWRTLTCGAGNQGAICAADASPVRIRSGNHAKDTRHIVAYVGLSSAQADVGKWSNRQLVLRRSSTIRNFRPAISIVIGARSNLGQRSEHHRFPIFRNVRPSAVGVETVRSAIIRISSYTVELEFAVVAATCLWSISSPGTKKSTTTSVCRPPSTCACVQISLPAPGPSSVLVIPSPQDQPQLDHELRRSS